MLFTYFILANCQLKFQFLVHQNYQSNTIQLHSKPIQRPFKDHSKTIQCSFKEHSTNDQPTLKATITLFMQFLGFIIDQSCLQCSLPNCCWFVVDLLLNVLDRLLNGCWMIVEWLLNDCWMVFEWSLNGIDWKLNGIWVKFEWDKKSILCICSLDYWCYGPIKQQIYDYSTLFNNHSKVIQNHSNPFKKHSRSDFFQQNYKQACSPV